MRWFRRTKRSTELEAATRSTEVALRTERALVALAVHAHQLSDRMGQLEARLDEVAQRDLEVPTHDDLLEVRVHSAKVAAEVSRLSVNLRARIDDVTARLSAERRAAQVAEPVLGLAQSDTVLGDTAAGSADPWARSA